MILFTINYIVDYVTSPEKKLQSFLKLIVANLKFDLNQNLIKLRRKKEISLDNKLIIFLK